MVEENHRYAEQFLFKEMAVNFQVGPLDGVP
jgi:hypothetical protein